LRFHGGIVPLDFIIRCSTLAKSCAFFALVALRVCAKKAIESPFSEEKVTLAAFAIG
jgi:hypothetical protein